MLVAAVVGVVVAGMGVLLIMLLLSLVVMVVARVLVLELSIVVVWLSVLVASCVTLPGVTLLRVVLCAALDVFVCKIPVVVAVVAGSHLHTEAFIRGVSVPRSALPSLHAIFSPGIFFNKLNRITLLFDL